MELKGVAGPMVDGADFLRKIGLSPLNLNRRLRLIHSHFGEEKFRCEDHLCYLKLYLMDESAIAVGVPGILRSVMTSKKDSCMILNKSFSGSGDHFFPHIEQFLEDPWLAYNRFAPKKHNRDLWLTHKKKSDGLVVWDL